MKSQSHPLNSNAAQREQIYVWDLLTRIAHWALALTVLSNATFTEDWRDLHR